MRTQTLSTVMSQHLAVVQRMCLQQTSHPVKRRMGQMTSRSKDASHNIYTENKPFSTSEMPHTPENDIGKFVQATMSAQEITDTIRNLSHEDKYALLRDHRKPANLFVFPVTHLARYNRSFNNRRLDEYPWNYVPLDGVFSIACALFCQNRMNKGQFLDFYCPFMQWHKRT